ncbi:MAG: hypothetical protein ACYC1Q_08575 [Bacteroidia bacterium]
MSACGPKKLPATDPALIIGDPLSIGSDTSLIFPVGVSYYAPQINNKKEVDITEEGTYKNITFQNRSSNLQDNNATSEYYNPSEEDSDIRNILFYSLNSKKSKPLLQDTLHILSFAVHHEFVRPCILYRMVRRDYNEDKKYNSKDPVMLFVSNINGDSLVQLSPESEKFVEYFYYPKQSLILIKTMIDKDGDKVFTNFDETNMLEVDLLNPQPGREIFDSTLKESLRGMVK